MWCDLSSLFSFASSSCCCLLLFRWWENYMRFLQHNKKIIRRTEFMSSYLFEYLTKKRLLRGTLLRKTQSRHVIWLLSIIQQCVSVTVEKIERERESGKMMLIQILLRLWFFINACILLNSDLNVKIDVDFTTKKGQKPAVLFVNGKLAYSELLFIFVICLGGCVFVFVYMFTLLSLFFHFHSKKSISFERKINWNENQFYHLFIQKCWDFGKKTTDWLAYMWNFNYSRDKKMN